LGSAVVLEERWPVLGRHERAAEWLRVWTDLGRAPRTIDAYVRGLAEYLTVCERDGLDPVAANRLQVAAFVKDLSTRPSRRGSNVVALDSGAGLANATLQQRLVPVRLFYDYLIEEGLRQSNPVGRGRYTPGRQFGGHQRGLVPRLTKLPWIPSEQQWLDLLDVVREEPVRNRVMLALAYDAALRRRNCAPCGPTTSTLPTARFGSAWRRRRPGASASFRTRRRPGSCCRATLRTGPRSAGPAARCSCRSRAATTASR
jgi:integrase/recombinase XerD